MPSTPTIDFDFQRYVARRKGAKEAQAREGAAYAFSGDVRLLRTFDRLRPVALAVEETGRLFRSLARAELLADTTKITSEQHPALVRAANRCAQTLHIDPPAIYLKRDAETILTLGTAEEAYIIIPQSLLADSPGGASLGGSELLDLIGRECGRIQNGHIPYLTALHYLSTRSGGFVRWVVTPATMTLSAWVRRANFTADRAGLLCSKNLDASLSTLRKVTVPSGDESQLSSQGRKDLLRRERALLTFARSAYYRTVAGESPDGADSQGSCDAKVAKIFDSDPERDDVDADGAL